MIGLVQMLDLPLTEPVCYRVHMRLDDEESDQVLIGVCCESYSCSGNYLGERTNGWGYVDAYSCGLCYALIPIGNDTNQALPHQCLGQLHVLQQ